MIVVAETFHRILNLFYPDLTFHNVPNQVEILFFCESCDDVWFVSQSCWIMNGTQLVHKFGEVHKIKIVLFHEEIQML